MYMGVLWSGTRKSGKTPPFSPIFQPICMQMCPLHIIREGKASNHAQSKLLIFYPIYLLFTRFYLRNALGLYFVVIISNMCLRAQGRCPSAVCVKVSSWCIFWPSLVTLANA